MAVGPLAQVIKNGLHEDPSESGGCLCRFSKCRGFMVVGRAGIVNNVAILHETPHILIADVCLHQMTGGLKDFKVAVAAWDSPTQPDWTRITELTVRVLAGEFHTDVRDVLKHMRESCMVQVAAWKPGRVGPSRWAMSTSVLFTIGPIGDNKIFWDRPSDWEDIQQSTDTTTMVQMGAFPADQNVWTNLHCQLSTTWYSPTHQLDVSGSWTIIPMVKQKSQKVHIPYTEKLFISAGSNKPHRSHVAMKRRHVNQDARWDAKPWW